MIEVADSLSGETFAQPVAPKCLEIGDFLNEHGRVPLLGKDELPPWKYRGWMRPFVQTCHMDHPDIPNRWGFWWHTMEHGKLPDGPIPRLKFSMDGGNSAELRTVENWLKTVQERHGGWSSMRALIDWLGWAMGTTQEEPKMFDDRLNEHLYRTVNVGPMLLKPYDYLGTVLSATKAKGWNPTAFFPTPHQVVECMVEMTMADYKAEGRDPRLMSVCDPCVGTGRMLMHASNYSVNLWGMDIDPMVVAITKLNGAFYAPWIAWPFPKEVLGERPSMTVRDVIAEPLLEHVKTRVDQVVAALMELGEDPLDHGIDVTEPDKPVVHEVSRAGQMSLFGGLQALKNKKRS